MKRTRRLRPAYAAALGLGLGLVVLLLTAPPAGLAQPVRTRRLNLTGSTVSTQDCFEDGKTQTLCFTVHNGSPDAEWLDEVRLTFPNVGGLGPWDVDCKSQDATDSSGSPVNMTCSTPSTNEVRYDDNETEFPDAIGEISSGTSWSFCVDLNIPSGYNGPRVINWGLSGDEDGSEPHYIEGSFQIEHCTPLMLRPDLLEVGGCNGLPQSHTFSLWNNSASGGTFNLSYNVPSGNGLLAGPPSFSLSAGETVTFEVELTPDRCLAASDQMTATIHASGNSESDTSTIVKTISLFSGWGYRPASPISTMDNVVVWARHDGGLWSIGGYGSNGATQRYDLGTNTWSVHAPETDITPTIEYPMDGCYGLNADLHEVVVLFPDTIVTGSLHIYDITADGWYTESTPVWYPEEGRWGHDVVSLYGLTGENVCYLSGGSPQAGGGRTRDLWQYFPATNGGSYLGAFYTPSVVFNFHASWYVPWVGTNGAICVGGGVDYNSQIVDSTQCYDLDPAVPLANRFRPINGDLGPLPEPWWGMADGWQVRYGEYQIWIANGVAQDGTLIRASAYADATTGGFVYGPTPGTALYRLEGDGFFNSFYMEQGAAGGFSYSPHSQVLELCPWCSNCFLPLVLRNH